MRLVLMDAAFLDTEGVGTELQFAVNRRRKPPKPGIVPRKFWRKEAIFISCWNVKPAARFRVFSGQLTVQQVDSQ